VNLINHELEYTKVVSNAELCQPSDTTELSERLSSIMSDRIVQPVSRWADFHEILHWLGGEGCQTLSRDKTQVAEDRTDCMTTCVQL
jgi:hypothetical protein